MHTSSSQYLLTFSLTYFSTVGRPYVAPAPALIVCSASGMAELSANS
jgi:hypothetical protein